MNNRSRENIDIFVFEYIISLVSTTSSLFNLVVGIINASSTAYVTIVTYNIRLLAYLVRSLGITLVYWWKLRFLKFIR